MSTATTRPSTIHRPDRSSEAVTTTKEQIR